MQPVLAVDLVASAILAALVLAGLLLVHRLLRLRLDAFGEDLARLRRDVQALAARADAERAEAGREGASGVDLAPIEEQMEALRAAFDSFVTELDQRGLPAAPTAARSADPAKDLEEQITTRFRRRGFQRLHIVSDLRGATRGEARILVEGTRNGLVYKGHVRVQDGVVVGDDLASSHEVFP